MRIRQVKPDYWRDELIASLPDSVGLFYIGLWQEADDAGWLVWNIPEIGHDLYGYQPRTRRERWVKERGEALASAGRLHFHACGHAYLPNLTKHQHLGGKPYRGVQIAHDRDCSRPIEDDRHGKVGKGKVMERVGGGTEGEKSDLPPLTADQAAAIAMNQSILDDPHASEQAQRVARKYLMKLGVAS